MAGSGDEAVVDVELRRLIIDGVHHDEPGSGGLAGGNSLAERFGQQQRHHQLRPRAKTAKLQVRWLA